MARPKLSDLEKAQRLHTRLEGKIESMELLVARDPDGPIRYPLLGAVGRPPVPYKKQLERLQQQYLENQDRIAKLRLEDQVEEKNASNPPDNQHLEKVMYCRTVSPISEAKVDGVRDAVGRPHNYEVQKLEYKIRQIEQRIVRIANGKESSAIDDNVGNTGSKRGRRRQTKESKIARLKSSIEELQSLIKKFEVDMTPYELEDLAIRRLSHQLSQIRKQIREKKISINQLGSTLGPSHLCRSHLGRSHLAADVSDLNMDLTALTVQYESLDKEIKHRRAALGIN